VLLSLYHCTVLYTATPQVLYTECFPYSESSSCPVLLPRCHCVSLYHPALTPCFPLSGFTSRKHYLYGVSPDSVKLPPCNNVGIVSRCH